MSSTATTVKTKQRSSSSASQKFWPLKKFGLHHTKTEETQLPSSNVKAEQITTKETQDAQQKRPKRLSSLLSSSRRQEVNRNFENLQSHVNTPESIAADNTKSNHVSNTPTLTKKMGRDLGGRVRVISQTSAASKQNMTAKSAGSGTITSPLKGRKSVRRSSEDKFVKRPQSPPTKRNESPTQPAIMLDSVQQQIQKESKNELLKESKPADMPMLELKNSPKIETQSVIETKEQNNGSFEEQVAQEEQTEEENNQTVLLVRTPSPSPPFTNAVTETGVPELTSSEETSATDSSQDEPASPILGPSDIPKPSDMDKQQNYVQQPFQRIQRLRSAASLTTLRQLASTNNFHQQQQPQSPYLQQQPQPPLLHSQQIPHIKKRPVSYVESSSNSYFNYMNDAYLSVNKPTYSRRASSEDNRQFEQTYPMNRLVKSNTIHNLIIRDGYSHRIVQCVGLDEPALQRKTSHEFSCWSPPPETVERPEEDMYSQHPQHLGVDNTDNSSSDSGSNHDMSNRKIRRRDSAKSIGTVWSNTPPSYDSRFDKLRGKLEKERATIKVLQKQKEACNKDVLFLNKQVDTLTAENNELKKKFENEKTQRERFQDDLSSAMDNFNEATEQIRQLEAQTKMLKSEIDDKNNRIRELEKKNSNQSNRMKNERKQSLGSSSGDRLLVAQLQHSQNQVRLLKSTMEQFLRMGVFNDDLHPFNSNMTSPTTSIEAIVSDLRCGRSRQKRSQYKNKSSTTSSKTEDASIPTTPVPTKKPSANNSETENTKKASKTPEKVNDEANVELDIQLRELLREKELLQAEYSKAPSSGGNALVRRRREELENRLDTVDSQMCRIKLKMRSRNIL